MKKAYLCKKYAMVVLAGTLAMEEYDPSHMTAYWDIISV